MLQVGNIPTPAQANNGKREKPKPVENVHQKFKKQRGMSFEGKCAAVLKLMRDSNAFWKIPEIEAQGRSIGVVPQSVKEVVLTLVSEKKAKNEKVGSQQIYWALASEEKAGLMNRKEKLTADLSTKTSKVQGLQNQKAQLEQNAVDKNVAQQAKNDTDVLRKEMETMMSTVKAMQENDPAEIAKKKSLLEQMMDEANRVADNAVVQKKRGEITTEQMNEHFGFPAEFVVYDLDEYLAKP